MRNRFSYLTCFSMFILFAGLCFGQATSDVSGTVLDASGAAIPGAEVTIKNLGTNATRTALSNSAGLYTFNNLQPASYSITATAAGFNSFNTKVDVTVGGRFVIDAKLSVGNSTVSVDVSANQTTLVNTESPEVSQVISQEQLSQLPSLTRNPYDFVALSGNVSNGDNTASGAVQNGANRGVNFSLNGQRNSGTEILLDGVENISVFGDAIGINVPIDAVQEYRVITNNFSPEYGRASGGVVALATKSGTNQFHGTVFEFNRISALTANTVTNAQTGTPKGIYTRNQFGGAVGGPIYKDKAFFFGSTEFIRVRSSAPSVVAVLDPAFLALTPTNIQAFYTAYAGTNKFTTVGTTTNLQAGGGTTPLYSSLNPSTPIFDSVSYTAPIDAGGGLPQNTYNILGRVDYNFGAKTQAFFRYVRYNEIDQTGAASSSPYAQYNVGESNKGDAYLLSVARQINSSLASLTKLSFARTNVSNSYDTALQNVPTLNVAPSAQDPASGREIETPGFYAPTPGNGGLPYGGPQNTIQYNQDINYTKGRHQIQGGGQVLYIQENSAYGAYAQANEQLGSSQPKGLQALLTGSLYRFQAAVNPNGATPCARDPYSSALIQTAACTINLPATAPTFARSNRFHDWAVYAQDQWKASSRLTLDYGVRYEYFGVQHNNNQKLDANFYYGAGSSIPQEVRSGSVLTVPNSPIGKLWNPQYGTVSPRLGFAYDVFGNGKTSFRGGYGISYERNFGNVTFNLIQNPPNYAVVVISNTPVTNSNAGPLAGAAGSVALPPTSLRHVDQDIRTAQTQFYSASIDEQLGHRTAFEVTYNAARGIHLYDIKNYNIPGSGNFYLGDPYQDPQGRKDSDGNVLTGLTSLNPHFANDNNRGSNGDSYYHALNVQFTTQDIYHSGLSIVANYTLAHATDDLSTTFSETSAGNFSLGYTNPLNPALDHGNSDFDIRHRFVLAPIYRTPWFSTRKTSLIGRLLGGYEFTGIYTVRTGTPFTIYDSTNDNSGYSIPRYTPASAITQHTFKSIPHQLDNGNDYQLTGATTLPVNVPFGNAALGGISDFGPYPAAMTARNSFRGPGAYNLNISVSKSFPITERINFELRGEGFDVTNHHNLYIQGSQTDAFNYGGGTGNPQIFASKGGVAGGANDERRFIQLAGKINF
jgi:Carboxypeptidase regulatory-like domain